MKKWIKRIAVGMSLIPVLFLTFVYLRSAIPVAVPDQDLRLARAQIPADQNAFETLQAAASHIWWLTNRDRQFRDFANDTNWDNALAAAVLASNRMTLAGWDTAAQMPALQVPEITRIDDLTPYLKKWREMAVLAGIQENALFRDGRDKEALEQVRRHIQLGWRMQNAGSPWIGYLVGANVHATGLRQLRRWIGRTRATPADLREYIREIEISPADEAAAFANAARAAYGEAAGTVEAWRQGKFNQTTNGIGGRIATGWIFNTSRTKVLLARQFLPLLNNASRHFNQMTFPVTKRQPSGFALLLSGNAVGYLMSIMLAPEGTNFLAKKCQIDTAVQATRVILALRAYQLAHGRLPSDLSALVPEFLPAVPVDDFDGQPLRYSPEKKIVYSVGKNLKDDSGDDRDTGPYAERHLDLAYPIDF